MNKISRISTVCFNIEGTLVKHSENIENDVLRTLGLELSEEFNDQVRYFWDNLSKRLQKGQIVERDKIYTLVTEMIPYLSKINLSAEEWFSLSDEVDNAKLIDGVYEILEYLQEQGYYIIALTNWFTFNQFDVLKKLKIFDCFERIFRWDKICVKPHRKELYSLSNTQFRDSIVFIGDCVRNDIKFANNFHIKSTGYKLKYNERSEYFKPTVHIANLLEIKKYL
ncbi:MAG: HAD family hydrolase [Clostridia bacterium]|nr:HAD family hydrolase [Clostridia bacterium]MDD4386638.1 HAD family hydrolase [Clostridia bacterium]